MSRTGFNHKTSLTDWRSLYSHGRPKTQSLILNFNMQKIIELQDGYHVELDKKRVNKMKLRHWPPVKKDEIPESKTAFNFYRSPEIQN